MDAGFSIAISTVVDAAIFRPSFFPWVSTRPRSESRDRAVWVVRNLVTYQRARIGRAAVGDGRTSILGYHVDVKIHQPLATNARVDASHAVCGVAGRTGKSGVDMALVLLEAGVRHDIAQTVAFAAHRVGPIHAEIGVPEKIGDQLARFHRLAKFVAPFQNVGPLGAVRTVRTGASKLAIVVAVVAVGAEHLRSHHTPLGNAIEIHMLVSRLG